MDEAQMKRTVAMAIAYLDSSAEQRAKETSKQRLRQMLEHAERLERDAQSRLSLVSETRSPGQRRPQLRLIINPHFKAPHTR